MECSFPKYQQSKLEQVMGPHSTNRSSNVIEENTWEAQVSAEEHRRSLENRQRLREMRVKRLRAKVNRRSLPQPLKSRSVWIPLSCNNESWKGTPFDRRPITYPNQKILPYYFDRHWGPWREALSPVVVVRRTMVLRLPSTLSPPEGENEGVNRGRGWEISLL